MRGTNDLGRQSPADTVMNSSRHSIVLGSGIEVERPAVVPIAHDASRSNSSALCCCATKRITSAQRRDVEDGIGARAVLHVHGMTLAPALSIALTPSSRLVRKSSRDAIDGVCGAGLPDHERRLVVGEDLRQPGAMSAVVHAAEHAP